MSPGGALSHGRLLGTPSSPAPLRGGHCSFFLRGAESERARASERAAKAGRGARARRRSHPRARRRAATMLNNLTDCEDGDGGEENLAQEPQVHQGGAAEPKAGALHLPCRGAP